MVISYLICGILTTAVNFVIYFTLTQWFCISYLISNAIAWVLSVLFAFVTNKKFVFYINNKNGNFWREITYFFSCRFLSGALDMGFMFLLVTILSVNDAISKVLVGIFVVVFNYLVSKLIIFV